MKITSSRIKTLLTIGESQGIEFKRAADGPKADTFESVCAFLNKTGGDLFLGVGDDGEVVGLPAKGVEPMIRNFIKVMNDPNLFEPTTQLYPVHVVYKGKHLIHVHVPESPEVHRFKGVTYVRVHEADVRVKGTDPIAQLFIRKQHIFTEQKVYPHVTKKDLRMDLIPIVKNMCEARVGHPWLQMSADQILRSAQLLGVDAETGKKGVKAAGVLLLGSDDVIGDLFPAYMTDALLRRVNVDRYDDRETIRTNLIESYDKLLAFGEKHLPDKFYLEGDQRVSLRNKILREMIGNLLVHREFSSSRYARFIIEQDRMYTENANRAVHYGQITLKNLEPVAKNPIIASFFHQIGRADELGSGVRNLYHYVKLYSNAEPDFEEDDLFRLVVPLDPNYSTDVLSPERTTLKTTLRTTPKTTLKEHDQKIVELMLNRPDVSISEIAKATGLTRDGVNNAIRRLKRIAGVVRVGGRKFGHWEVTTKGGGK